ncbi:MAG: chromosome segregation protein ScpA [Actinobacteria bacterium]|nr:MAG: chromosome segregation protein ScpA [Actinomycetota bacterium]
MLRTSSGRFGSTRTYLQCCSCCRRRSSSGGSSSGAARPGPTARARRPSCRRDPPWPCRRGASAHLAKVRRVIVRELELDLDAFEGPFDLLLTLVLKEELDLADVDVAGIVLGFVERLAEREELDLEACGEFLILVSALMELKARGLFPDEEAELAELEPEEAAEELARRLAEYRRMKEAAAWMRERLAGERDRFFRVGPAPLAPEPERRLAPQDPDGLASVLRLLAVAPPEVSLAHMTLHFPPVAQFLERFRALLRSRSMFDFDQEMEGLSRQEQAVAFLALLELRRANQITISQAAPFAPIRIGRTEETGASNERTPAWNLRSA